MPLPSGTGGGSVSAGFGSRGACGQYGRLVLYFVVVECVGMTLSLLESLEPSSRQPPPRRKDGRLWNCQPCERGGHRERDHFIACLSQASIPTDKDILLSLEVVFRTVMDNSAIVRMYDNALKSKPDDELYNLQLFHAYGRTREYEKQKIVRRNDCTP